MLPPAAHQEPPREPQERPRRAQEAPRRFLEAPRSLLGDSRSLPGEPKSLPGGPRIVTMLSDREFSIKVAGPPSAHEPRYRCHRQSRDHIGRKYRCHRQSRAQVPRQNRQRLSEPDPWRGVGGRDKSLRGLDSIGIGIGLDWIGGLEGTLHALRPKGLGGFLTGTRTSTTIRLGLHQYGGVV